MEFFETRAAGAALLAAGGTWIRNLPLGDWPTWVWVLLGLWIAMLGAAVGSFLNVVIYRSPRGMSLLRPGSHCPSCRHPIRARDNLPILGWLLLGGRCRDCSAKISPRYPLIEALVAALFVGLAALDLGMEGASLPALVDEARGPFSWTERRLTALCAFHLLLVTYLVAAAGMRCDGQRVPTWLSITVAAIGLVAPCLWPWLRPMESGISLRGSPGVEALIGGIAGALTGYFAGAARTELTLRAKSSRSRNDGPGRKRSASNRLGWLALSPRVNLAYVVVGAFLGWQAIIIVASVAAVLGVVLALSRVGRNAMTRLPDEVWVLMFVLALLTSLKWTSELTSRGAIELLVLLAGALSIALLSAYQRRLLAQMRP